MLMRSKRSKLHPTQRLPLVSYAVASVLDHTDSGVDFRRDDRSPREAQEGCSGRAC